MTENDLFGAADVPDDMTRPLAVRMRPRTVDEVLGQSHVLGEGSPLRRLANPSSKGSLTAPSSIIMFGPPGVGKTTMALAFSKALSLRYNRVQFTPDVMPSDITGFTLYNKEAGRMEYQPGAVLCLSLIHI